MTVDRHAFDAADFIVNSYKRGKAAARLQKFHNLPSFIGKEN